MHAEGLAKLVAQSIESQRDMITYNYVFVILAVANRTEKVLCIFTLSRAKELAEFRISDSEFCQFGYRINGSQLFVWFQHAL